MEVTQAVVGLAAGQSARLDHAQRTPAVAEEFVAAWRLCACAGPVVV